MRRLLLFATLAAAATALLAMGAASVATAQPGEATITFSEESDGHTCTVTVTSSKEISNYTVNGVKTEGPNTTTLVLTGLSEGDVITVKSGRTTASYTVIGPCAVTHDHNGDGHFHDPGDGHVHHPHDHH